MKADKLSLIVRLTDPANRAANARALAESIGAVDLSLFLFDDDVHALLPAPGFPQTLPDGRKWKAFFKEVTSKNSFRSRLVYVDSSEPVDVLGLRASDGSILVLFGGEPDEHEVNEVVLLMPLLAAAFRGEALVSVAKARATIAQEMASDSAILAESLDRARRELGVALSDAKRAGDALREADRRKDEFLATLAHELRNPLAPLSNALDLLKMAPDKLGVLGKVQGVMERQVSQMIRLIDDLMDVSRITQGKVELRKETVGLRAIMHSAVELVRPLLEENNHGLTVNLPDEDILLNVDTVRITQVLSNLLNNAAKYTPSGGKVDVAAYIHGSSAVVTVKDSGVGIPADKLDSVFEMFAQVESSLERSRGGLGIGLMLVKKLVEMHGGTINASSPGLGLGSTFTLSLPVVAAPTQTHANRAADPSKLSSKTYRVLVVDDNKPSADTMMWTMETLGHTAEVCYDGPTAIAHATEFLPDIILLDLGLPGISGYEICQTLRGNPAFADTIIIAQTGWGQKEHRERSKLAGFDYHLVKPVQLEKLEEILDDLTSPLNVS